MTNFKGCAIETDQCKLQPRPSSVFRIQTHQITTGFRLIPVVSLLLVVFLTGCAGLPQTLRQSLVVVVPHQVDFVELEYYAQRSRAAYTSASEIRRQFPRTTRVTTVKSVDVLYFLETDRQQNTQTLTIRGTVNKPNVWQDAEIELVKDNRLGINLHKGFRDDAVKIYADVKPYLKKNYSIRVTGHSLGAAIAAINAGYLHKDGFKVDRLVTFGGPKVTDKEGKKAVPSSIIPTRVVHDDDVVSMLPPSGFLFGSYQHFGPEVILRDGRKYVYLPDHDANRLSIGEFWRNITDFSTKDHHMSAYLSNIEEKVENGARQVPYFGLATASGSGAYASTAPVNSNSGQTAQAR